MAQVKTAPNKRSVSTFLRQIHDENRRGDAFELLRMMGQATGAKPEMWGDSIVGFGRYHYKYASGREGQWFLTGFSPRKQNMTLYIMPGFERYAALMKKLGKHKTGKSCLYVKRLSELNLPVLKELIRKSVREMAKTGR